MKSLNLLHRIASKIYEAERERFYARNPGNNRAWKSFRRLVGKEKEFWFAHAQRFLSAFPSNKRPRPQRMDTSGWFNHSAYVATAT